MDAAPTRKRRLSDDEINHRKRLVPPDYLEDRWDSQHAIDLGFDAYEYWLCDGKGVLFEEPVSPQVEHPSDRAQALFSPSPSMTSSEFASPSSSTPTTNSIIVRSPGNMAPALPVALEAAPISVQDSAPEESHPAPEIIVIVIDD